MALCKLKQFTTVSKSLIIVVNYSFTEGSMKRTLLFLMAALLLCVSAVSAQDTGLNLMTVGHLFKWSDTVQDVLGTLAQFEDYTVNDADYDASTISIPAERSTDDKQTYCYFYFDASSEVLKEVECVDIFFSDEVPFDFAEEVIQSYDLDSVDAYSDDFTLGYTSDLDGSMTVAGEDTICIIGGNDPTDEFYGFLTLVFLNRAFN